MEDSLCSNTFINDLDFNVRKKLLKYCEWTELAEKKIISNPNQVIEHIYFPSGALISVMLQQKEDKALELGLIGEEGLLGIEPILGVYKSPFDATVHTQGLALKISTLHLLKLMDSHQNLKTRLFLYVAVLNNQLAQAAICNRFHLVDQRLAKLLLMLQNRLHSSKFMITQDLLAVMLGVRRVGVTKAASLFQKQNIVHYSRGRIEILNVIALEKIACSCYAIDKSTYQSIMHF